MTTQAGAGWPFYADDEISKAAEILRSGKVNYWTGSEGRAFETEYAKYLGREHAVAVANGTVALELALEAFGIGPGDEVIVPARTYIATASAAVVRGAKPVVVDVDPDSQCIDANAIEAAITPRTRAVIVVHLAGWPCDMDAIMGLAQRKNIRVIEDCAQAHGAFYKDKPVGSFGDAAAFSFCQDKIISTGGEGGLLALDDTAAWKRAWAYKDIGRSYDAVYNRFHPPGFKWVTESFGTNWRLTEVQAAIGRIQLKKLPAWIESRRKNAARLRQAIRDLSAVRSPEPPVNVVHSYYRFTAAIVPGNLAPGWSRDRCLVEIEAAGVPCGVGSCSEIYLEKAFADRGWAPERRLPVARELGETAMAFLVHPTLSAQEIDRTASVLRNVFERAQKGV